MHSKAHPIRRKHERRLERINPTKETEKYKHALAVKREIDSDGDHVGTDIEIRGEALADWFREKYGALEGSRLREAPPVVCDMLSK